MEEKLLEHVKQRDSMNTFMHYNFNERVAMEPDYAVCKLEVRPESLNPFGMIHGGAICTLADNAAGVAAHTDGRLYVTQNSTFYFMGNQRSGTIYATARVRHRGRSTVLIQVDITGDNEKLLATAEFSMFCVGNGVHEEAAEKEKK
ncbi:PaaI family thioesterase [Oscillibacter sp.]|uniref:PaaI family thioesterase n=1 Tax=Oscillibacter sp. TaxID=1945593 RepID=UPI00262F0A34|nr:PaaI family thioesterase [Oscillibacter sp.]MDD3346090.1 PaaI family thioesterase [Oscillibacter sp.]